jgi:hypothetical protein
VRLLELNTVGSEPTGFLFSPDGRTAYVTVQHSDDPTDGSLDVDDYKTDDVLKIEGFADPSTL